MSATFYALVWRLTILRDRSFPAADPEALALNVVGWVLCDTARASRLLALTGLTPETLRSGLENREVLAAVLDFLCAHEPDLVAAAGALGVEPHQIVDAGARLQA